MLCYVSQQPDEVCTIILMPQLRKQWHREVKQLLKIIQPGSALFFEARKRNYSPCLFHFCSINWPIPFQLNLPIALCSPLCPTTPFPENPSDLFLALISRSLGLERVWKEAHRSRSRVLALPNREQLLLFPFRIMLSNAQPSTNESAALQGLIDWVS